MGFTVQNKKPDSAGDWFWLVFFVLLIVGNLLILAIAWQDKSYMAASMGFIFGPVLNAVLLVSGLVAIPFLKRVEPGFSVADHLKLILGGPIAAILVDVTAILFMGLHGC